MLIQSEVYSELEKRPKNLFSLVFAHVDAARVRSERIASTVIELNEYSLMRERDCSILPGSKGLRYALHILLEDNSVARLKHSI
jgi:hypothetical protein